MFSVKLGFSKTKYHAKSNYTIDLSDAVDKE